MTLRPSEISAFISIAAISWAVKINGSGLK